jgi:hypothetical protein
MEARWRLTGFEPRKTQDAFFALAREPVKICFFVGTRGDTRSPRSTLLLVNQHDAVFTAFVECARRTGRHTAWVEAMIADARQVKENEPFD